MIEAKRVGDRRIDVMVKIADGFHLYDADIDPRHGLTATRLHVQNNSTTSIEYPPAKQLNLPYGPPVAGYTNRLEIIVRFSENLPEKPVSMSLSYQACDDRMCLRPSVVRVEA